MILNKFRATRTLMGTEVSITVYASDRGNQAIDKAFQKMADLEALLSRFKEGSDVYRLNQSKTSPVKVSPITFEIISKSVEYGKMSGGAFDATVGPAQRLWEEAAKKNALPSPADLSEASKRVGYSHLVLDPKSTTVTFEKAGMAVDLGGIAKGHIVDEAAKVLRDMGIDCGLIDAGGDIYASGANPERGVWLIGIQDPFNLEENLKLLSVQDKAVATSGHAMRHYNVQGKRYSHIIDPRTCAPVQEDVASVTVVAPDVMTADAMATVIGVMGAEEGLEKLRALDGVEAFLVMRQNNKTSFMQSAGFADFVSKR